MIDDDGAPDDGQDNANRLGAYKVQRLLGRGGMGEVLLAWDERLRRNVAIKRILSEKADARNRQRFLREARAVACLNHPNIVQVFDIFEHGGADCIVMENVEGHELGELLGGGPLDVLTALHYSRDIADGLAEAHCKGFVHRDLKAANVRVAAASGRSTAGRAKILDFGIVLSLNPDLTESTQAGPTQVGGIVGTPHAMSPEQTLGRTVDHRSDLFSFGVLIYEMLTGISPFRSADILSTLTRVQRHHPPSVREARPEVPEVVAALVAQLLAKDANQRPSDTLRIAEELARLAVLVDDEMTGDLGDDDRRPRLSFLEEITMVEGGTLVDETLVDDAALAETATLVDGDTLTDEATLVDEDAPAAEAVFKGSSLEDIRLLLAESESKHVAQRVLLRTEPGSAGEHEVFLAACRELLPRFNGFEVVSHHGASLVLFERPPDAAGFAVAYHQALREEGLKTRVAAFYGEADLARVQAPEGVQLRVGGPARTAVERLVALAGPGQTLLNAPAFDVARRAAIAGLLADSDLRWFAHGTYVLMDVDDPVEVCELGFEGVAPLAPPEDGTAGYRSLAAGEKETVGWRPAAGQPVPRRPGWELLNRLGEGGFGEVWLAIENETGERRVYKFCFNATRVRALKREATLMRLLREALGSRKDIGRLLDWDFENGPYFIETEYTEGGDLHQWVENEGGIDQIPRETRLELAAETADALHAAHSIGILHKDVKPSNVLVRTDRKGVPHAVLVDFGIGVLTDRGELEGAGFTVMGFTAGETVEGQTSTGTVGYMSPEVIAGLNATVRSDVYSLGVLIYQLACGDLNRVVAPGWERHVGDRLLAEDLASIMDQDPEQRPESTRKVAELLRTLEPRRREKEAREALELADERRRKMQRQMSVLAAVLVVVVAFAIVAVLARNEAVRQRKQSQNMTRAAAASDQLARGRTANGNLLVLEVREPETTPTAMASLHESLQDPVEATFLEGHAAAVVDTRWSPDGEWVLTASEDGTARIWDSVSGNATTVLGGHTGGLTRAAWSPDGSRVATASDDGTARTWDARKGTQLAVLEGHGQPVQFLDWHPDGQRLVTVGDDLSLRIWDAEDATEIDRFQVPNGEAKAYTRVLWDNAGERVATNVGGGVVHVWDPAAGDAASLDAGEGKALGLEWSPDDRHLAASYESGAAALWNVASRSIAHRLEGHSTWTAAIHWSPDGRLLLTASNDTTARVWEAAGGRELARLEGHEADLWDATWSPDGGWIATAAADETAAVWSVDGRRIMRLAGPPGQVRTAAWSPDGQRVVTGHPVPAVWDPFAVGEALAVLRGHSDIVQDAAWSADERHVATVSDDHTGRVWDALTGRTTASLVGHLDVVSRVAWSPDGRLVGTASRDATARLWDAATGALVAVLEEHEDWVVPIAWSPDGQRIVTASHDGTVRLWDGGDGTPLLTMPTSGPGHEGKVHTAEWSADGRRILTTATDTTARIWDAESGRQVVVLAGHTTTIRALRSPDDARVLTFGYDAAVKVWNAATGALEADLVGHTDRLYTAAWSPDGSRVLTGCYDGTARVWDSETGREIHRLEHEDLLRKVSWSGDGRWIATAGDDGVIRLWSPETGEIVGRLVGHDGSIKRMAWSSDSRRLLTTSNDTTARIWTVTDEYPDYLRGRIRARLRRCLPAAFYEQNVALSEEDARQRHDNCAACLPGFFDALGDADRSDGKPFADAWRVYEGCLAVTLSD